MTAPGPGPGDVTGAGVGFSLSSSSSSSFGNNNSSTDVVKGNKAKEITGKLTSWLTSAVDSTAPMLDKYSEKIQSASVKLDEQTQSALRNFEEKSMSALEKGQQGFQAMLAVTAPHPGENGNDAENRNNNADENFLGGESKDETVEFGGPESSEPDHASVHSEGGAQRSGSKGSATWNLSENVRSMQSALASSGGVEKLKTSAGSWVEGMKRLGEKLPRADGSLGSAALGPNADDHDVSGGTQDSGTANIEGGAQEGGRFGTEDTATGGVPPGADAKTLAVETAQTVGQRVLLSSF